MPITFTKQVTKFSLPKKKLIDWLLLVSYIEQKEIDDISYIFCDDDYLLKLNEKFLHHRTYTDILTFDYSDGEKINAEIYISTDRIKENAQKFKVSFDEELRRVILHGVLHCIGYTDKTKKLQSKMREKENEYLLLFSQLK